MPLLASMALGGCGETRAVASVEAEGEARPQRLHRGELVERHLLSGELRAENALELEAPHLGIWPLQIRWLVADGAAVKAGERLVEFDNSSLADQLRQVETAVVESRNGLAGTRSQAASSVEQAHFTLLQRQADLKKAQIEADVPRDLVTAQEFQDKRLAFKRAELQYADAERALAEAERTARADVAIAEVELEKALRKVEEVQAGIGDLTLTALRDGIVVVAENPDEGRPWQVGDNIFPGRTVVRLPELKSMIVEAQLSDVDDGRIAPGMEAEVLLDAYPDRPLGGRVRTIDLVAQQVERQSRIRAFVVRVDLDSVDEARMRPGMSVKVVVEERHRDVLLIPRQGLDWSAPEGPWALLERGRRQVELGPCNALECIVLGGVEE